MGSDQNRSREIATGRFRSQPSKAPGTVILQPRRQPIKDTDGSVILLVYCKLKWQWTPCRSRFTRELLRLGSR
eukprot:3295533-Pyramimonas_sp.AAC.1